MTEAARTRLVKWGVVLLLLFYLGLQIYFLDLKPVGSDESLYAWYALQIHQDMGAVFSPMVWEYHPPLFSFLASLGVGLLTPLQAVRITSIGFGLFTILLTFLIGQRIGGNKIGFLSSLFLTTAGVFLGTAHQGILDTALMAAAALVGLSCLAWLEKPKAGFPWWGMGGIFLALMVKRSGFMVLGLPIAALLLYWKNAESHGHKNEGFSLSLFQKTILVLAGGGAIWSIWTFTRARDFIFSAGLFPTLLTNMLYFVSAMIPIMLLLAYFGIWMERKNRTPARLFLYAWILVYLLSFFYPIGTYRQYLPALPAMTVLAAIGFFHIPFERIILSRIARTGALLLIIGLSFSPAVGYFTQTSIPIGYAEEGAWLSAHAAEGWIYDFKERETRLFSGIELAKYGGRIREYPPTPEKFEAELKTLSGKKIYAIDMVWRNPFYGTYVDGPLLMRLGFKKVYAVWKTISPTQSGEVIRIYEYNGSGG
jgi:4-amino-4-deoxy-L-arabinose transferase-like glycosyltransferase